MKRRLIIIAALVAVGIAFSFSFYPFEPPYIRVIEHKEYGFTIADTQSVIEYYFMCSFQCIFIAFLVFIPCLKLIQKRFAEN